MTDYSFSKKYFIKNYEIEKLNNFSILLDNCKKDNYGKTNIEGLFEYLEDRFSGYQNNYLKNRSIKGIYGIVLIEYYKKDISGNFDLKKPYMYIDTIRTFHDEKDTSGYNLSDFKNEFLDNKDITYWTHYFYTEQLVTKFGLSNIGYIGFKNSIKETWLSPIQYYTSWKNELNGLPKRQNIKELVNKELLISDATNSPYDLMTEYINLELKESNYNNINIYITNKEKYGEWRFEHFSIRKSNNEEITKEEKAFIYYIAEIFMKRFLQKNPFTTFDFKDEWKNNFIF